MGVNACDRVGCERIMCNHMLLRNTEVICDECFAELLVVKNGWPDEISLAEAEASIRQFLESTKGTYYVVSKDEAFKLLAE